MCQLQHHDTDFISTFPTSFLVTALYIYIMLITVHFANTPKCSTILLFHYPSPSKSKYHVSITHHHDTDFISAILCIVPVTVLYTNYCTFRQTFKYIPLNIFHYSAVPLPNSSNTVSRESLHHWYELHFHLPYIIPRHRYMLVTVHFANTAKYIPLFRCSLNTLPRSHSTMCQTQYHESDFISTIPYHPPLQY